MHRADLLAASLRPQNVRPLILPPQCPILTFYDLAPPSACTSYRPFAAMPRTDPFYGLTPRLVGTSSRPIAEMHRAEPLAAPLRPKIVRHPVQPPMCTVLNLMRLRPALRTCVSGPITEMYRADHVGASLRSQYVCPLLSQKCTVLTLFCPCSALRMYVISSLHRNASG